MSPRPARTIEQWMEDEEREASPERRRVFAGIPVGYRNAQWRDYEGDVTCDTEEGHESFKDVLRHYAKTWPEQKEIHQGLIVVGPPGRGKTMGITLTAMEIIDQGGWVRFKPYADLVAEEIELMKMEGEAERNNDWGDHERLSIKLEWLKWRVDLLILDDVGKEHRTQSRFSDDLIDRILRKRVNEGKCTILTSNMPVLSWSGYNEALASFLNEVGETITLTSGGDRRSSNKQRVSRAGG